MEPSDKRNGARAVGLRLGFKLTKRSRVICWEDLDLLSSVSQLTVPLLKEWSAQS